MKLSFTYSSISLAVVSALFSSFPAIAANTDYSNQIVSGAISVIGQGNSISGDNLKVDQAGYQETSTRNEGVYIGDGSSAVFGGDYFEVSFSADDPTHEFAGVQVNGQGNETKAIFASQSTVIDVKGPVSSGKWGFGLLVNGTGNASAEFTGGDVFIRSTTEDYTSQTLTVKAGNSIHFNNTGDITVESYSPFGVTVVDAYGDLTFNNKGDVFLKGEIIPGESTAQTNVVGLQGNHSWSVTDNVGKFKISLSGAGVDSNGTSYSTGTKGIDAMGADTTISINAKEFEIEMDIASDLVNESPEGHTSEEAFGIFIDSGAKLTIGSETTSKIDIQEGLGTAYGLYVGLGANVSVAGDASISVKGKENSYAVMLNGADYYDEDSEIKPASLTFGGEHNQFTGNIVASNQSSINFEDGQSIVDGNVDIDATSNVALEKASIELTKGNNIEIKGQLDSTQGEIVVNEARAGAVHIAKLSQGSSLRAVATASLNDALGSDIETFSQTFNIESGAEGTILLMKEGMVAGQTSALLNSDGTVDKSSVVKMTNSLMQSSLELAASAPLSIVRILTNDVRKRLGDIRSSSGTNGVWARYDGGGLSSNHSLDMDFHTVQFGVDTAPTSNNMRFGIAFSYTKGDTDYQRGSSDMDVFSLAGYGTWIADNGLFVDVIGRMATVKNDMTVDHNLDGSTDSVVLGLSAETGWRFDVTDMFYVEPQIEAAYSYVDGDKFSLGNAEYNVNSVDSFVGRVGFLTGFKCPSNFGDAYLRVSAVHEFLGDSEITGQSFGSTGKYRFDGKDTWIEYGMGANFNLTKNTYLWADIERTSGSEIDEDWRATAGVRYSW